MARGARASRLTGAYTPPVTRTVLIVGLLLLAVFVPLAAMPLQTVVVEPLVFAVGVVSFVSATAQPVALLALEFFRAPPSR